MLLPSSGGKRSLASTGVVLLVLALGALASFFVYQAVDVSGRGHILDRVNTIAKAVPLSDFRALSGSMADLGTPSYENLKRLLTEVRSVNSDARFIYLIGVNAGDELFFYVDSEDPSSEDYSPPGEVYFEATPAMHAFFEDGQSISEGPDQDRWGFWISGYAPLTDESGRVLALVGMDLPAERFIADTLIYSALPLLVALLIVVMLMAAEGRRRQEHAAIAEREEFLSIASHEIRTPVTGMRWAIESMLKRTDALPEDARSLLSLMHASALALVSRLNNLLDVAALDARGKTAITKEPVAVDELLHGILASLELPARERDVTFAAPPATGVTVRADKQILHHALFNLLANAVKYTRPGTQVAVSYARTDGMDEFRIQDHGEGIPPAEQTRVFEGYHRAEAARKSGVAGTGLGLYLVKRAVELHGGTITLESRLGQGTTFIVRLPT